MVELEQQLKMKTDECKTLGQKITELEKTYLLRIEYLTREKENFDKKCTQLTKEVIDLQKKFAEGEQRHSSKLDELQEKYSHDITQDMEDRYSVVIEDLYV